MQLLVCNNKLYYLGEIANNRFKPRITGRAKTNQTKLAVAFLVSSWLRKTVLGYLIRFVCGGTFKSVATKKIPKTSKSRRIKKSKSFVNSTYLKVNYILFSKIDHCEFLSDLGHPNWPISWLSNMASQEILYKVLLAPSK